MKKLGSGTRLVVASHNKGKVWEINQLLAPYGLTAVSAGDLGLAEPEETEDNFEGNALIKARAAAEGSGLPALADDSGLGDRRARRRARRLFRELGGTGQGFCTRHAARP